MKQRRIKAATLGLLLAAGAFAAGAQTREGQKEDPRCERIDARQGYGPYDYRNRHGKTRENLGIVEEFHFGSKQQRAVLQGSTATFVWKDLDYTLRAFPNHAKALYLLGLYSYQMSRENPKFFQSLERRPDYSPAQCYFRRAMRFAPDDPNIWNTLGRLQTMQGSHAEAVKSFGKVVELAPRSAAAHYNLGLAYYAAGRYDESLAAAQKAYALGYRGQDLKRRLAAKGHWE